MKKKKLKWSIKDQAHFLKRIGELLSRGYPISEAIESLSFQMSHLRKEELNYVLINLKNGHPFYQGLERLGFHEDLIGYVYFAEQHGSIAEALLEGSKLVLQKDLDKQKLIKILQYPMFLAFFTGLLFIFLENTLLPKFTSLFKSMNLEENLFTTFIYAFGRAFPMMLIVLIISLTLIGFYHFFIFRKLPILKQKDLLAKIPFIGRILQLLYTHYFSVQLSFLLAGGISVYEALMIFESNIRQPFYSQLGKAIKMKLVTGEKLESILRCYPFFEKEFPVIIKHGQENGKLEQELYLYSQHCMSIVEEIMEKRLKIIQPILYSLIGFLAVSMYLAILLPMFHLLDGI